MRVVLAAVAAAAATVLIAVPAEAAITGIISCSATAAANSYGRCTFVVEPGTYRLEITSTAAYASASVACGTGLSEPLFVSVSGGGRRTVTGPLRDPVCTLEVMATSGGSATAQVLRTAK